MADKIMEVFLGKFDQRMRAILGNDVIDGRVQISAAIVQAAAERVANEVLAEEDPELAKTKRLEMVMRRDPDDPNNFYPDPRWVEVAP